MFITVSGIDGSGKSTFLRALALKISQETGHVQLTSEPGGTYLGRAIRRLLVDLAPRDEQIVRFGSLTETVNVVVLETPLPVTELLLFSAARAQHFERVREWIKDGEIVLCDRGADCTFAYQGALGIPDADIEACERIATNGEQPDITFWLDLSVEEALKRMSWREGGKDRIESHGLSFFRTVRERYAQRARQYPDRIVRLDATRPPSELVEIAYNTWRERVMPRLGSSLTKTDQAKELAIAYYNKGHVFLATDLARELKTSRSQVHRALGELYEKFPQYKFTDAQIMAERTRRMNAGRKAAGYPALKKQAEEGYPNLKTARANLAARQTAQQRQEQA